MGKKQGAVATDGVNRRRMSNNRKRNWQNKCNRKNILEKKLKDPGIYLTSKPMCVTVYRASIHNPLHAARDSIIG